MGPLSPACRGHCPEPVARTLPLAQAPLGLCQLLTRWTAPLVTQVGHRSQRCWWARGFLLPSTNLHTNLLTDQKPPGATRFLILECAHHLHDQKTIFSRETKDPSCPEGLAVGKLQCACRASCPSAMHAGPCPPEKPHHARPSAQKPGGHRSSLRSSRSGPAQSPQVQVCSPLRTGLQTGPAHRAAWQSPA